MWGAHVRCQTMMALGYLHAFVGEKETLPPGNHVFVVESIGIDIDGRII